jgi:RNA polymerase sigma-70 factor (ECF subfamily)
LRLVGPKLRECGCIFSQNPFPNKMQPEFRQFSPTARRGFGLIAPLKDASASAPVLSSVNQGRADADLADVTRVLAGDVEAFEGIVRRWQGPLVNMAWRYCRDRGRAEEMAQEAFIRAWRNLGSWRRESSFSTWLFALAANVFRSDLKRFPTVNVPIEDAPEPAAPATQHRELAAQSIADSVRRAVLALPPRYREPVVLFYFHEMDIPATARTMGVPDGTLKARLSRARALLRRRFPHLETAHAEIGVGDLDRGKEA